MKLFGRKKSRSLTREQKRYRLKLILAILFFVSSFSATAYVLATSSDLAVKPMASSGSEVTSLSTAPGTSDVEFSEEQEQNLDNFLSQTNVGGFDTSSIDWTSSANANFYSQYSSNSTDFCSSGCNIYDSSGNYISVNCYSSLNSCNIYDSNGNYANVHCYSYINSCSTTTSDGDYYNTHCYEYINSCNTSGSDGYYSNTNCYDYINSCNTSDSYGNYYNTHCYSYINSCTTTGSDGSYTTTRCYEYIDYCSSTSY